MPAADDFLRTLNKSELVAEDRVAWIVNQIPAEERSDARKIADRFIATDALTPFQAQKLLDGISTGLRLGRYVIRSPIARGGMGTVYLAKDGRKDRLVAIKIMSPQRAKEGKRHLLRFQREIELTRKLDHRNIAQAVDVGLEHGIHYLVLEYIPGKTLNKLVQENGPLAVDRAARIFVDVADGLTHAHSQGVIHRDLKPANIMVLPRDKAKVLDLGLALIHGERSEDIELLGGRGYLVGSIDYMAPEQTRDPTLVDARADLYALGCSIYYAVTGKAPFAETPAKEKVKAQRQQMPMPLTQRNPAVPEGFARIVERLMAKQPDDRPASAAEARALLLPWSEGTPTSEATFLPVNPEVGDQNLYRQDTLAEAFAGLQTSTDSLTSLENVRQLFEEATEFRRKVIQTLSMVGVFLVTAAVVYVLINLMRR
jgi:serine/threonine protein kinase